ncbi:MAG: hypothetical protein ACTS5A_00010 [Candidatus Hodgkinia cicadicola]
MVDRKCHHFDVWLNLPRSLFRILLNIVIGLWALMEDHFTPIDQVTSSRDI